ncbi:GGDEF domain-containing phosphodiesterase [Paracoccus spongiarum]|uniref:GGDEF domain-containing phosphodiesterase n=1 Tax=Paracoccus spongiarum TaxID=3064387 RepID=A0ABT9JD47_9RHOB|nr:GGDEF domain-containing phosphodiesterase [Paracoccus sp. 2205BS29-5]MDP5307594.1 GGDEF domain-containing phosphodiesterase [Paracoccus sp. 2205BS29-5]
MLARLKHSGLALLDAARRHLRRARTSQTRSVLLLRLENTELLSKHLGKAGFNHLLVNLSMRLGRTIRPEDPVQIIGTGSFAITLRGRSEIEAMRIARRLQDNAQRKVAAAGMTVTPVLSGVMVHAEAPGMATLSDLVDQARSRLEDLATDRLGQVVLFDHDPRLSAPDLPATVTEACAAGQIVAHFQPQLSCHSGEVTGFEALARWNHPTRGLLLPGGFMPQMGEADHKALTLSMLRQAIAALKAWDAEGWEVPTVSVNISNCELADPGFAPGLLWELDRQDIRPDRLVLEVLESFAPVTSSPEARTNLATLTKAGCRLDLDDFGTGYASLDAIRQFGVHRIKIDRSFVLGCDVDPAQQRMILAILALAERLDIAALAEGVESREEHAFLAQMGCDEVQGYAIARPMSLDATRDFLRSHARRAGDLPSVLRKNAG